MFRKVELNKFNGISFKLELVIESNGQSFILFKNDKLGIMILRNNP